jgi:kynurenine formamidase
MRPEFHELAEKVNNWGRWGEADERGTLNFITPEVVKAASACVRSGKTFSLAIPLSADGPQIGMIPGRINPLKTMLAINDPMTGNVDDFCTSDDTVVMGLQAGTHWDSLAHATYSNRIYNGAPIDSLTVRGAGRCGIDKVGALVSRGVLLDVARAKGVDTLEPGYALTGADLDAAAEFGKVSVRSGDIVLVRTGQIQKLHAGDKMGYTVPSPGFSMQTALWLHDHEVAAVANDTIVFECFPGEYEDLPLPVHLLHLVEMGLTQGQNWDLEALAADCADDGQYDFLLTATPEPFVAGLGAPVAPVAVK